MREVLLLVGTGRTAFNSKQINLLIEKLKNIEDTQVSVIDNGEYDISI